MAKTVAINPKINEVKNKISNINNLAKTVAINPKINEVKNKIPNITNLATTAARIAVENKTPDHSKRVTTQEV